MTARLTAIGDDLERAARARSPPLRRAAAAGSSGGAVALAILLPGGALAASLLTDGGRRALAAAGTRFLVGTQPSCEVVKAGRRVPLHDQGRLRVRDRRLAEGHGRADRRRDQARQRRLPLAARRRPRMALLHRPGGRRPADHRPGLPRRVRARPRAWGDLNTRRSNLARPAGGIEAACNPVGWDASCLAFSSGRSPSSTVPPSPAWLRPARGRPSTTSPTPTARSGASRTSRRRASTPAAIRATQVGAGQNPAYSTTINGYGGIKVWVSTTPAPRFNGELMRGFGLTFDGVDRFTTTQAVPLGGVEISRSVYVKKDAPVGQASWARWLDTFTQHDGRAAHGQGRLRRPVGLQPVRRATRARWSTPPAATRRSPRADAWAEVATPLSGTTLVGGPQATVIGTPAPFGGAMTFTGNWLHDTFNNPLAYGGHEGNFQAYVNTLTLAAGRDEVAAALRRARPARHRGDVRRRAPEGRGHRGDARRHAGPRPA